MRWVRIAAVLLFFPPAFLLAAVSAGAAVAAHFGRTSLRFDLLAHFAPLWLAGAALALVIAFAFRGVARLLIASMAGVGVLAALALIAPEVVRPTGPRAPADAAGQLKVIQFNVWYLNDDLDRTVDWLVSQDPDVVVLEEIRPELRALLARRTGWHTSCQVCEVTILSKLKPISTKTPGLHGRPRGPLGYARFRNQGGEFVVVGVHNDWPTNGLDQQAQEARLAGVLAAVDRKSAIVTGDFNSTPWSFSRQRWDRAFGLIRRERALPTWPAQRYKQLGWLGLFPFLPIDHVYAGPGWATVKVERGPRLGSDHYPVVVTLAPVAPR
jgi:endonuclease/exonuclease/phosphatase (EEP) superfamily protein YafD